MMDFISRLPSRFFRADARTLSVGDIIFPEGNYQASHKPAGTFMEEALVRNSPPKAPVRSDGLFVTPKLSNAKRYSEDHPGRWVYRVSILKTDILHYGDMDWTDRIGRLMTAHLTADYSARAYWRGLLGRKPYIEYVVRKATVLAIVDTPDKAYERLRDRITPNRDKSPTMSSDLFEKLLKGEYLE